MHRDFYGGDADISDGPECQQTEEFSSITWRVMSHMTVGKVRRVLFGVASFCSVISSFATAQGADRREAAAIVNQIFEKHDPTSFDRLSGTFTSSPDGLLRVIQPHFRNCLCQFESILALMNPKQRLMTYLTYSTDVPQREVTLDEFRGRLRDLGIDVEVPSKKKLGQILSELRSRFIDAYPDGNFKDALKLWNDSKSKARQSIDHANLAFWGNNLMHTLSTRWSLMHLMGASQFGQQLIMFEVYPSREVAIEKLRKSFQISQFTVFLTLASGSQDMGLEAWRRAYHLSSDWVGTTAYRIVVYGRKWLELFLDHEDVDGLKMFQHMAQSRAMYPLDLNSDEDKTTFEHDFLLHTEFIQVRPKDLAPILNRDVSDAQVESFEFPDDLGKRMKPIFKQAVQELVGSEEYRQL